MRGRRGYCEATVPRIRLERTIFVGGGVGKALCRHWAAGLGLKAHAGDPLAGLVDSGKPEAGATADCPSAWTVALRLVLNPAAAVASAA